MQPASADGRPERAATCSLTRAAERPPVHDRPDVLDVAGVPGVDAVARRRTPRLPPAAARRHGARRDRRRRSSRAAASPSVLASGARLSVSARRRVCAVAVQQRRDRDLRDVRASTKLIAGPGGRDRKLALLADLLAEAARIAQHLVEPRRSQQRPVDRAARHLRLDPALPARDWDVVAVDVVRQQHRAHPRAGGVEQRTDQRGRILQLGAREVERVDPRRAPSPTSPARASRTALRSRRPRPPPRRRRGRSAPLLPPRTVAPRCASGGATNRPVLPRAPVTSTVVIASSQSFAASDRRRLPSRRACPTARNRDGRLQRIGKRAASRYRERHELHGGRPLQRAERAGRRAGGGDPRRGRARGRDDAPRGARLLRARRRPRLRRALPRQLRRAAALSSTPGSRAARSSTAASCRRSRPRRRGRPPPSGSR